jgi:hypothetical protein
MKNRTIAAAWIGAAAVIIAALIPMFLNHRSGEPETDKSIAGIVVDQDTNHGVGQASITVAGRTEEYQTENNSPRSTPRPPPRSRN